MTTLNLVAYNIDQVTEPVEWTADESIVTEAYLAQKCVEYSAKRITVEDHRFSTRNIDRYILTYEP